MEKESQNKKVYIAGKITNLPYEEVKQRFAAVAENLKAHGYEPVNPCEVSPFREGKEWREYMADCIPALIRCDYILMLSGWLDSEGAKLEHYVARAFKIQILFEKEITSKS